MNTMQLRRQEERSRGTLDPFRTYLREIAKHPVPSKDEEREIAERITVHNDKKAEERLITANLRLVVKMAFQYCHEERHFLDLIQEGNLGLLKAVKRFDPGRGTRFSTYATYWIRAYMLRYLMDTRSIVKIGTTVAERKLSYCLNKEKQRLKKAGLETSPEVLAKALSVDASDIEDTEPRLRCIDVSLDEPLYEEGGGLLHAISTGEDIEETIADRQEWQLVAQWLTDFKERLNDKQRFVLDHRIMSDDPITLDKIAERFQASRESIRQMQVIISNALVKTLRSRATGSAREPVVRLLRGGAGTLRMVRRSYGAYEDAGIGQVA